MNRPVVVMVGVAALVAAVVLTWIDVRQKREFRRLIAAGDAALAANRTLGAVEAFSGALVLRRDSMLAYLKRGDTYRRREEYQAALRDLQQAAALDATAPQPVELLGDVYAAMGEHAHAAEQYRRYIGLDDRAPRVLYKLALTYYRSGQTAAAVDPLRRAIGIDDRLSEAHYLLGLCLRDVKRTSEAMRELTRAVALDESAAPAREVLSDLYLAAGRRREAVEQIEELTAIAPDRPDRAARLGLLYARVGRMDAALATLERAATQYPDDPGVLTALGRVWLDDAANGNLAAIASATSALQRAAAQPTADTRTLALYGHALLLSGRYDAAEKALIDATAKLPVDAAWLRDLAEAASHNKHTEVAQNALSRQQALSAP